MKDLKYLLSKNYSIVLWCDSDGDWIAKNPELHGCTADGKTPQEALASLEISRKLWLEASLANGLEVPEPQEASPCSDRDQSIEQRAIELLMGRCHNLESHGKLKFEEFLAQGGSVCPICLTKAFKELALAAVAVVVQVEHGYENPNVKYLRQCINAFVPLKKQTEVEAAQQTPKP